MAQAMSNIKVLAFICKDPEHLPHGSYEQDLGKLTCLISFRNEVTNGKLAPFWNARESPKGIAYMIYKALNQQDNNSLQGWVRGSVSGNAQDTILDRAQKDPSNAERNLRDFGYTSIHQFGDR